MPAGPPPPGSLATAEAFDALHQQATDRMRRHKAAAELVKRSLPCTPSPEPETPT